MKRFIEDRKVARRASIVEMVTDEKLGRFKPPALTEEDIKIMTIQRNAAGLMRAHPSLARILKHHDFDRDLPDADRLHQVAMLFETGGLGIRRSPKDALRFHKFAAVLGHHRSQGVMGEYYEVGKTENRNPRRARTLYRESSRASDARAQYNLGRVFYHGLLGQRANQRNARLLFEKAAKRRHKGAQSALGYMYEKGEGDLKADYNHAKRYYGMAANQGCDRSAFNLGHLYEKNLVITESDAVRYDLARSWYRRAEALGYARAEVRLAHIATIPEASAPPTEEEKKQEDQEDSDVDEMLDSDGDDADDEAKGARDGVPGSGAHDGAATDILNSISGVLSGATVDTAPTIPSTDPSPNP